MSIPSTDKVPGKKEIDETLSVCHACGLLLKKWSEVDLCIPGTCFCDPTTLAATDWTRVDFLSQRQNSMSSQWPMNWPGPKSFCGSGEDEVDTRRGQTKAQEWGNDGRS